MGAGEFLNIYPMELKFPFELRKLSSCSLQLSNKTDQYIAFKVKTTNPKKYCVRPNVGIILPGSICTVTVTMQAQKEAPPDMQCKDKFLIQSVIAPKGATAKDITQDMFNTVNGKVVEEFKLRVACIPANPPSPVPEESEEDSSPRASITDEDTVTRSSIVPKDKSQSLEVWSIVSRLNEEKAIALQQNQKIRQELELLRRHIDKTNASGFSMLFAGLIGLLGVLVGYLIKRT